MAIVKATIFFEKRFWVGTFERTDKEGYAVARHIFGAEPSDSEVYEFVLKHYVELKFGKDKEITIQIQRMNPKRVQREVRREMEKMRGTGFRPEILEMVWQLMNVLEGIGFRSLSWDKFNKRFSENFT